MCVARTHARTHAKPQRRPIRNIARECADTTVKPRAAQCSCVVIPCSGTWGGAPCTSQ
jgi:hypothetical protein